MKKSYPRPTDGHYSPKRPEKAALPRRHLRGQPASRASRALQIQLTEASAWDRSSQDGEHVLLCDLLPPHGLLFTWLPGSAGPRPPALERRCAKLSSHEHEAFAVDEVAAAVFDIVSEPDELHGILGHRAARATQAPHGRRPGGGRSAALPGAAAPVDGCRRAGRRQPW